MKKNQQTKLNTKQMNRVTTENEKPLDYAVRLGREDLCDLLIRYGASPQLEPQIELAKKLKFTRIADKLRALYGMSEVRKIEKKYKVEGDEMKGDEMRGERRRKTKYFTQKRTNGFKESACQKWESSV